MGEMCTGLSIILVSFLVFCQCQGQSWCPPEDVRDLVYGQSFYTLSDSTDGDPNLALRNASSYNFHPKYVASSTSENVTFTILVPNIFHGVQMRKITMLTRNVIRVVSVVTLESEIETKENGELQVFAGGVGEFVDDILPRKKYQRTTFRVMGDVAHLQLIFQRGNKGRIQIQKLYINGCKGQTGN